MGYRVFKGVSVRSSQEVNDLHRGKSGPLCGSRKIKTRRFDHSWDSRYVGDDRYESFSLAFAGSQGADRSLDNIRIDAYGNGADCLRISDQRYGV